MRPAVSIPAFFLLGAMSLPWGVPRFARIRRSRRKSKLPFRHSKLPFPSLFHPKKFTNFRKPRFRRPNAETETNSSDVSVSARIHGHGCPVPHENAVPKRWKPS